RMLTIEWQALSPDLGYEVPSEVEAVGAADDWRGVMERSANLFRAMREAGLQEAAQYGVSMAYRIRFVMEMNAREAMHLIELRTTPQGHPVYRRVCPARPLPSAGGGGHPARAGGTSLVDHARREAGRRG